MVKLKSGLLLVFLILVKLTDRIGGDTIASALALGHHLLARLGVHPLGKGDRAPGIVAYVTNGLRHEGCQLGTVKLGIIECQSTFHWQPRLKAVIDNLIVNSRNLRVCTGAPRIVTVRRTKVAWRGFALLAPPAHGDHLG